MQRTVLALIATPLLLTGCDVDLFGLDSKRLGGGYSLELTETDDACALVLLIRTVAQWLLRLVGKSL